ncbi:MAG: hypothetical protein M5U26_01785 [Planctomycetota bacterium]|nr:hypothetical protein [Planctomycetota bacterium]
MKARTIETVVPDDHRIAVPREIPAGTRVWVFVVESFEPGGARATFRDKARKAGQGLSLNEFKRFRTEMWGRLSDAGESTDDPGGG